MYEAILTAAVTVLVSGGGFFALVKYAIRKVGDLQENHIKAIQIQADTFMEYIQKKNGVNERIADTFAKSNEVRDKKYEELMEKILKKL